MKQYSFLLNIPKELHINGETNHYIDTVAKELAKVNESDTIHAIDIVFKVDSYLSNAVTDFKELNKYATICAAQYFASVNKLPNLAQAV